MTPEPQVGDLINVTITGARVIDTNPPFAKKHGPAVMVALPGKNGEDAKGAIWTDLSAITIEIVEPACPAEWPPRVGDLWRDRHAEVWFGIDARDLNNPGTPVVELVGLWGERLTPAVMHRDRGPLALVRRETDDPAVRDCSMDTYDCGCDHADDGEPELQPEEVRLLARQIDGWACIRCGSAPALDKPMEPAGIVDGRQVFWCAADCRTTVETAPAGVWPPQAGDMWKDRDGDLWFATDMNAADDPTGPCIEFVSTSLGDHEDPDEARRRWGPLGLVYRKYADQ